MLFLIKKQAGISEGMVTGTATKLSPATAGYLNKPFHRTRIKPRTPHP